MLDEGYVHGCPAKDTRAESRDELEDRRVRCRCHGWIGVGVSISDDTQEPTLAIRSILIGAAVLACSNPTTAPAPTEPAAPGIQVVNATAEPFAFFAIASDLAPLLDPVPETSVHEPWVRVVAPGNDEPLGELSGREQAPGGGVAVFLYELIDDGARVRFSRVHLASGQEIRRSGDRIVVR